MFFMFTLGCFILFFSHTLADPPTYLIQEQRREEDGNEGDTVPQGRF